MNGFTSLLKIYIRHPKTSQRHLEPEQQLSFAENSYRVPTKPRSILLRLNPHEKAGFRLREKRTKLKARFFISYVETNSRSAKSGLRVGDEILSINGSKGRG